MPTMLTWIGILGCGICGLLGICLLALVMIFAILNVLASLWAEHSTLLRLIMKEWNKYRHPRLAELQAEIVALKADMGRLKAQLAQK